MDTFVDYYHLLHVQPTAPTAVIKASYRTMLQKLNHHPDRGGDVAFAQLLNAAATTLCDAQARAHYDQLRQQQLALQKNNRKQQSESKPSAWGEPGGSPERKRSEGTQDQHKAKEAASDPKQNSGSARKNEPYGDQKLLPTRPQCPFCQSTYVNFDAERRMATGYITANRCQVCNAARTQIEHVLASSNDELRRMHRQHHETSAKLWPYWPTPSPVESILTDFSPAGCAISYPQAIANSDVVMLETELFNAICKVRHCKPSGEGQYTIGLEFVTLDMLARPGTLLSASA